MSDLNENEGQARDPKSERKRMLLESMSYIRKDVIENASIDPEKCFSYIKNIKGDVNAFNSYYRNQEDLRIAIVNYLNNEDKQIHLLMRQTIDNEAQKTKIEYFHFGKSFSLDNAYEFLEQYDVHSFAQETEQLKTPPLERQNINSKEHSMSDLNENVEEQTSVKTPEEAAFLNAVHQRKVVADALKNGTLSCLPKADGYADTTPAVNLVNGTYYHGANMLFLKEHQKENGFPSAEYVTSDQIDKARIDNPRIAIRKEQHGVSIQFSQQNEETGKWENKSIRLFNVAQTVKPNELKAYAEQKQQEKLQEKIEYMQKQYGTKWEPPAPKQSAPGPEITCKSTEPSEYLGQYLAAVSMGGKFKATPEQAKEFAQNMENSLFEKVGISKTTGEAVSNPFKLSEISNKASTHCKQVMQEVGMEIRKANQQQHEQQRGFSR